MTRALDTDRQRIERLNADDWQKSHWRKFESADDHAERVERAKHEAGGYFQAATVRQKAAYNATMAALRGMMGPRYDRARAAANAEWARSTVEADDLYQITAEAIFVHGECPEEIAELWDDLDVRQAVSDAMEEA